MSTIIEDIAWLADARARYLHGDARKMYDGARGSFWALSPIDQALYGEASTAQNVARMMESGDALGWVPSWLEDQWEARAVERNARRAEAEALRAEVESAVADYVRLYRVPYALPPNLTLAVNALALLHAETGL